MNPFPAIAVKVPGLVNPTIIAMNGRQPVVAQIGSGLNAGNVPSALQFAAVGSVPTTRQPTK
jgi:hypothetical protein